MATMSVRCAVFEIFDFNNTMTLKTGLGSVKVIENIIIRYSAYDFLSTFYSKYGYIDLSFLRYSMSISSS